MRLLSVPGLLVSLLAFGASACHAVVDAEGPVVRVPRRAAIVRVAADGPAVRVHGDAPVVAPERGPECDPRFVEELGPPPSVRGNGQRVRLGCGVYRGDLVVRGNDVVVEGSGPGQSVVIGSLVLRGNDNAVRGVTFTHPSAVRGNANDVQTSEFAGGVRLRGNDIAP